jgi:hypothetical protein
MISTRWQVIAELFAALDRLRDENMTVLLVNPMAALDGHAGAVSVHANGLIEGATACGRRVRRCVREPGSCRRSRLAMVLALIHGRLSAFSYSFNDFFMRQSIDFSQVIG